MIYALCGISPSTIIEKFRRTIISIDKKQIMLSFNVHVIIENKSGISDPEGDTILNDLVLKGSYSSVYQIRSAKMLKFKIKEKDKKQAEIKIRKLCDELRIYNPIVSQITIKVSTD